MNFIKKTRGFRNNNPGNIKKGSKWIGLSFLQSDKHFCKFQSIEYGIRAIFKILETYRRKHGINTMASMIYRWAPPSENNTVSYINIVKKRTNINPDELLSIIEYPKIVEAIIFMENGFQPFSLEFISSCKYLED